MEIYSKLKKYILKYRNILVKYRNGIEYISKIWKNYMVKYRCKYIVEYRNWGKCIVEYI